MKPTKKKVLIFGGSGMVGSRIVQLLSPFYTILAPSHQKVNVVDRKQTEKVIERFEPNWIIYAAGLTDIEKAEKQEKEAFLLNSTPLECIAKKSVKVGSTLCYLSTNAVFDGKLNTKGYNENDIPNPISSYGKSKLLGEEIVLRRSSKNSVMRLVMVYSHVYKKKQSFVQKVLTSLKQKQRVYGVIDQFSNPTFVDDAVWALDAIVKNNKPGIFHAGSLDAMSNFAFIKQLAKTFRFDENTIIPVSFAEFYRESKVQRPQYGSLDVGKFIKTFGDNILHTVTQDLLLFKNQI